MDRFAQSDDTLKKLLARGKSGDNFNVTDKTNLDQTDALRNAQVDRPTASARPAADRRGRGYWFSNR